jgi:mannan endo-1,4-beta-mannosidase
MKNCLKFLVIVLSFFLISCSTGRFANYITSDRDKLRDGDEEFRFVSFNIPGLHYIEDDLNFTQQNPWRLPTEYEIRDALTSIKQMGGKVARMYVLSVRKSGESKNIIRHVLAPGVFNEDAFKTLDKVLQIANETGVRVIIPFVDNWWWMGGPKEYADFRGKKQEEFWTDPQLISDFKETIRFLVNRKNTFTGVLYKEDKAILGWETGNEIVAPYSWTNSIAAYIKSLDKRHLVIYGTNIRILSDEALNDTNLDVLTTHHYGQTDQSIREILKNKELTRGKKPYYVGEFGLAPTPLIKKIVDTVIASNITGIMIWSLRFHNSDGGFYMHAENTGSGPYRWPGFASGEMYDEKNIIHFMREKAFQIDGKKMPPIEKPEPPELFDIKDVYAISWRGSTGAYAYKIERKEESSDSWKIIADSISDADKYYSSLFIDSTAELSKNYYYRIRAFNSAGISEYSNIAGPVRVNFNAIIDELENSSKFFMKEGSLEFLTYQDIYKAKEDHNRLKGKDNAFVIYQIPNNIDSIKVQTFFTGSQCPIEIFASGSLLYLKDTVSSFQQLTPKVETFPPYNNYYGFYTPAIYTCSEFPENSRFLKILFKGEAQLSRVEIIYNKINNMSK